MRNFKLRDFAGSGQYLVRQEPGVEFVTNTGYLSTIMFKVGYLYGSTGNGQVRCLISMSDGFVQDGHFVTVPPRPPSTTPSKYKVLWQSSKPLDVEEGIQLFIKYLNEGETEYRFATLEEVLRVVMHHTGRVKK